MDGETRAGFLSMNSHGRDAVLPYRSFGNEGAHLEQQ